MCSKLCSHWPVKSKHEDWEREREEGEEADAEAEDKDYDDDGGDQIWPADKK